MAASEQGMEERESPIGEDATLGAVPAQDCHYGDREPYRQRSLQQR